MERQPEGVQVVEGVGLVPGGFQFFTRLAAVFAEEVGGFIYFSIGFIIIIPQESVSDFLFFS